MRADNFARTAVVRNNGRGSAGMRFENRVTEGVSKTREDEFIIAELSREKYVVIDIFLSSCCQSKAAELGDD